MSLIICTEHEPLLAPSDEDIAVSRRLGIPARLFVGMVVGAWVRAEFGGFLVEDRALVHYGEEPSSSLATVMMMAGDNLIGALGFALPLQCDRRMRARAVGWEATFDANTGFGSRN